MRLQFCPVFVRFTEKLIFFSPVPEFGGKAENFAPFRQEVELRILVTQNLNLPLNRRAPALALAMDKMPRELCLAIGLDVLKPDGGADEIMEILQQHIKPDASDAANRDIILFLVLRRPHLTLDEYLSRFQMARRRMEARLPYGGTFPGIFSPSLRLRNAGLTQNQQSAVMASGGGDPSLE